ncbi:MAG TPA: hypothetical protein VKU37_09350 [Verrucomicrobiae bacterium]|nr:hypothetical protein [Verrucomicrobiae bacterium]
MTPLELCHEAARHGLRLEPRGDKLAVIPATRVPPAFADALRQHKIELLNWLSQAPCPGWQAVPPDNLPFNPVMPRPLPHDRERVIGYLLRQGCGSHDPLTAWLLRRECAYYDGTGQRWDCALHAYAAARDAACWQLKRSERDVLDLLAGFDECSRIGRTES